MSSTALTNASEIKKIVTKGEAGKLDPKNPKNFDSLKDPTFIKEVAVYETYKKTTDTLKTKFAPLEALIVTVSTLETKKEKGSLTPEEIKQLEQAILDRDGLVDLINSSIQPSALEVERIKQAYAIQQIENIRPSPKAGLNYIKPTDVIEYIVRTQAINPYGRERECDIRFVKMVSLAAGSMKIESDDLKKLKALITQKVLNYQKGPV